MSEMGQTQKSGRATGQPLYPQEQTSPAGPVWSEKGQQRKSRLFDHLVPTGEHLSAMVIRAARLAAILRRIARGLRHADKGSARL